MAELLIRPSFQDHLAIADLLMPARSPALASIRRPISRLVLDAPLAAQFPQYREAAHDAGTPVLVDPLTMLFQYETDPGIAWAKLPYARSSRIDDRLTNPFVLDQLVKQVVDFQVEHGATSIIAPYFYAKSPADPAFEASLDALRRTARYLRAEHPGLPLVAVLCAGNSFARPATQSLGIDRFAQVALDLGPQMLGLCLSPNGDGREGDAKVLQLFTSAQRLKLTGATVVAWRQGFYGPGLVAAGLDGYEVGTGVNERTDIAGFAGNRKPGCRDGDGGGSHAPVFVQALGRSLPMKTTKLLLEDRVTRALIVCRDQRCCPHGAASMIAPSSRRQHNIRTRARQLRDIDLMPQPSWRLHQVAKEAYSSAVMVGKLNRALAEAGENTEFPTRAYEALAHVAELLSDAHESRVA